MPLAKNMIIWFFRIRLITLLLLQNLFAAADEFGNISISDFFIAGSSLAVLRGDPTGVNDIKFNRFGQLFAVGNSPKAQVQANMIKILMNICV